MSTRAAAVLWYGLGTLVTTFLIAPVAVPFGIYVYERWLVRNECVPVKAQGPQ